MTETDAEPPAAPASAPMRWDWRPKLRWFAAEYLIVVLGVLTAVGINAAWADWQTGTRAEVFTARLTDDVRYEAWSYEYLIEYQKDVFAAAETAVAGLSGDSLMSDEAVLIAAYRATQYLYNAQHRSTFDELISTGEIGLIADDTLRATALDVFTSVTTLLEEMRDEGIHSEYRRLFRRLVPAPVQHALLQSCGDRVIEPGNYEAIDHSLDYKCGLDLPPEQIAAAASALRSAPAVLPALQLRYANLETNLFNLTLSLPDLRHSLQRIAGRSA